MDIVSLCHQLQQRLRFVLKAFFTVVAAASLLVCTLGSSASNAQTLKVVASFSIIADLVKQVGAEHVEVTSLVRPGSDAHMFEPTAQDARLLSQADILFINGLGFEPWIERLKNAAGFKGREIVVSDGIQVLTMDEEAHMQNEHSHEDGSHGHGHNHHTDSGHAHGGIDPHAWQNVRNVIIYVRRIEAALAAADPAHAQQYAQRAQAYTAELQALDSKIRASIASLPENRRFLITTHDAFGYFGHTYGLTVIAPMGISTDEEPSAAGIAALINQVKTLQAPAVFLENITNPALMQQITRETNAALGGELYSDALSAPGSAADTYTGMMESNLQTLMRSLQINP